MIIENIENIEITGWHARLIVFVVLFVFAMGIFSIAEGIVKLFRKFFRK